MSVEMAKQKIKQIFNREIKHWKNGKVPYNAVALIREDVLNLLKDYVVIPRQKLQLLHDTLPLTFNKLSEEHWEFHALGSKTEWIEWLKKFEELTEK